MRGVCVLVVLVVGCATAEVAPAPETPVDAATVMPDGLIIHPPDATELTTPDAAVDAAVDAAPGCVEAPDTYSPFSGPGPYQSGTVTDYPWRGTSSMYPNGNENFSNYGSQQATVECSDVKAMRPYLDVTAGCLTEMPVGSYTRGMIGAEADDAFRVVALAHPPTDPDHAVKWTDMAVEYRFYYSVTHGTDNNPGFKAFARYRTEDDLYVASWRYDGVVQIQRKQCGVYTELIIDNNYGPPSKNAWHTLRFTAIGNQLQLTLDGHVAITATDNVFSWGTAGIRIDAMSGAYIDDWRVFAP
jgi:hypothetical protein